MDRVKTKTPRVSSVWTEAFQTHTVERQQLELKLFKKNNMQRFPETLWRELNLGKSKLPREFNPSLFLFLYIMKTGEDKIQIAKSYKENNYTPRQQPDCFWMRKELGQQRNRTSGCRLETERRRDDPTSVQEKVSLRLAPFVSDFAKMRGEVSPSSEIRSFSIFLLPLVPACSSNIAFASHRCWTLNKILIFRSRPPQPSSILLFSQSLI